jgi:glycerol-3-phosphate dehydrogenase
VANNLEVIGFIKNKNRIRGVRIKDILTGDEFDLRASFVVSTCGPWLQSILGLIEQSPEKRYGFSKAFDLVVKHKFLNDIAIGIRTQIKNYKTSELLGRRSRYLCITPWKNYSLIGTEHLPFEDNPDNLSIPEHEITNFLRKISEAYPQASLGLEDVRFVYKGCLPTIAAKRGSLHLASKFCIYYHGRENGLEGLIAVSGVKFTEARYVSEKVVDLVFAKLNRKLPNSHSSATAVYGGDMECFNDCILGEIRRKIFGSSPIDVQRLISSYGSIYADVLESIDKPRQLGFENTSELLKKAKILHAIREEMAHNLSDVLFRRTELGIDGQINCKDIMTRAEIMAQELNWSSGKIKEQVGEVTTVLSSLTLNG